MKIKNLTILPSGVPMIKHNTAKGIYYRGLDTHEWKVWYNEKIEDHFKSKGEKNEQ